MSGSTAEHSALPGEWKTDEDSRQPNAERYPARGRKVVSICGFCDLRSEELTTSNVQFSVTEFVELSSDRPVPVDEHAFNIGYRSTSSEVMDPASIETLDSLTQLVFNTVLPDHEENEGLRDIGPTW